MAKGIKRINPPGMKFCVQCGETKPLEEFPRASRSHDGRFTYCFPCTRARNAARPPQLRRRWTLSEKYGLTTEQYDAMLARQANACAICRRPMTELHVDHCHRTGRVRKLLCQACNQAIGLLEDRPEWCVAAATYLMEHTPEA